MRIYDISVPISAATPTYPGDPGIEITAWASIERGDAANVSLLHFGAHTATHLDAPVHFIEGTSGVDAISLDVLIGEAHVASIPEDVYAISADHIYGLNLEGATRVLFKTRNSSFWADEAGGFRQDFTYLAPDAARALVELNIKLVGMDYLSVEAFKPARYETHETLLSNEVVILEGLDLSSVPAGVYELICLPLKITGGSRDGAPARAILRAAD